MSLSQKSARTWILVTTFAFGVTGAFGLVLALTSFFLFDAPGSEKNPATIVLFCSALTLPVVCLVSIAMSWLFYIRKHFAVAACVSLLPLVNLACGAAALIWLQLFNHGNFS